MSRVGGKGSGTHTNHQHEGDQQPQSTSAVGDPALEARVGRTERYEVVQERLCSKQDPECGPLVTCAHILSIAPERK